MAVEVQEGVPSVITMGDAVSFTISNAEFPAGTWTSKCVFKDELGAVKSFDGVQSGTKHLFELSNTNTGTLVAGQNFVCLLFSDGSHRETREWGDINVLSDPAAADIPTFAQAQVTLIRSLLDSVHASGTTSVNFNGQSFTRSNINDLENQLVNWEAQVIRERQRAKERRGIKVPQSISPEFCSVSQSIPPFNSIR